MEKIKVNRKIKEIDAADLNYGSLSYSEFIEKATLTDKLQKNFENISVDISYYDDSLHISFSGERLETDEEFEVRLKAHEKNEARKRNIKLSQKEKELRTIKTLMKKNKLTSVILDE